MIRNDNLSCVLKNNSTNQQCAAKLYNYAVLLRYPETLMNISIRARQGVNALTLQFFKPMEY